MSVVAKIWPATFWRAFFVCAALGTGVWAGAPVTSPPDLAQVGLPDAAKAREILEQFRALGVPGEYFQTFELHALPRRGDEVVFQGRWWGGRNDHAAITRIELTDSQGRVRRLLVQNGEHPAVWRFDDGKVAPLGVAALFEAVIPGVEITTFDLQMPFLYWPDAKLERITRVLGRPAHAFLFRPPAAFASQHPELAAVRGYFDAQYNALVQADLIGADNKVFKLATLMELKKIVDPTTHAEQWIPKAIDFRNEVSRDKTRLVITGVALNQKFNATVFEPANLASEVRPPSNDRIISVEP